MKFKFNPKIPYQNECINSVVNLFEGQNKTRLEFGLPSLNLATLPLNNNEDEYKGGIGNRLEINDEDIFNNLHNIQNLNFLQNTNVLEDDLLNFVIEMETGTGKTYIYLKTIFELNKNYGFTKFIIVVPSIAIKEGVIKTLDMTKSHFKSLYENISYDYFLYDSSNLSDIHSFTSNSTIQIMIINIDSFNKNSNKKDGNINIIHRPNDALEGHKPIDLIRSTNPIVIIDEPQSSYNTEKAVDAVHSLNPLFTLQYSATPKKLYNPIYKLDAVDAYEQHLVKSIEVASIRSQDYHNDTFIRLIELNRRNSISAKVELDIDVDGYIKRDIKTIKHGDDLSSSKLTNREEYSNFIVDEINCTEDNEFIHFTNGVELKINDVVGDLPDNEIKRQQIQQTIIEHLDKELKLNPDNIKVLSLFFIDKVSNYRSSKEGEKGKYAIMFEEEYNRLIKSDKYKELRYHDVPVEEVHEGYFSQDKKGNYKDTTGKSNADNDTYNLIMKNKEELSDITKNNLRFIFSHSALKEGWDNPNVFQICTLNQTKSTSKKRQEIGRGLRLCVNKNGERIHDESINILTVIANESYKEFAENLQQEIEEDSKIPFGVIKLKTFENIIDKKGKLLGNRSQKIYNHFKQERYINKDGKVQPKLKDAIQNNTLSVPEDYKDLTPEIISKVKEVTKKINIRNAKKRKNVEVNPIVYPKEFEKLWEKIKYKTSYRINFDTFQLIRNCSKRISKEIHVSKPKILYTKAGLVIDAKGVKGEEKIEEIRNSKTDQIALPDIISYLQNETYLTRKTIVKILIESHSLEQFKKNPQQYSEQVLKIIRDELNKEMIEEIEYEKVDDFYPIEQFKETIETGYEDDNIIEGDYSVYKQVLCDSNVEKQFAQNINKETKQDESAIKVYTKLPSWYKIKTPIGYYNPDWAILEERNDQKTIYAIVETKGTTDSQQLRTKEQEKIACGKAHFKALSQDLKTDIKYVVADNYRTYKEEISDD